jgi:hypothetical protein
MLQQQQHCAAPLVAPGLLAWELSRSAPLRRRYTSDWAMDTLGQAFSESCTLAAQLCGAYLQQGRLAAAAARASAADDEVPRASDADNDAPLPGNDADAQTLSWHTGAESGSGYVAPEPPEQPATAGGLQQRVAAPLVAVQVALQKDTVVWSRGLLATPQVSAPLPPGRALRAWLAPLCLLLGSRQLGVPVESSSASTCGLRPCQAAHPAADRAARADGAGRAGRHAAAAGPADGAGDVRDCAARADRALHGADVRAVCGAAGAAAGSRAELPGQAGCRRAAGAAVAAPAARRQVAAGGAAAGGAAAGAAGGAGRGPAADAGQADAGGWQCRGGGLPGACPLVCTAPAVAPRCPSSWYTLPAQQ